MEINFMWLIAITRLQYLIKISCDDSRVQAIIHKYQHRRLYVSEMCHHFLLICKIFDIFLITWARLSTVLTLVSHL